MIVSVTMPRIVSMAETQLLEAQATNNRSSLGCTTIWLGCSPTPILATTRIYLADAGSRSEAVRRADRRHRHSAYLGTEPVLSPSSALRRHRRRTGDRQQSLDRHA